jgi:hypothetical protein
MDSPVSRKKPRLSELRPSESFKSEYEREFAGDRIKVTFNRFQDLNSFQTSTKGNGFFRCELCKIDNVIGKAGKAAIVDHNKSKAHQNAKKAMNSAAPMAQFVVKGPSTSEAYQNSIVEATMAYHIVKHHQGFVQADCLNELLPSKF